MGSALESPLITKICFKGLLSFAKKTTKNNEASICPLRTACLCLPALIYAGVFSIVFKKNLDAEE